MTPPRADVDVRPVQDDQWPVVARLWQLFRHDLATVVNGLPYADGRYRATRLDGFPSPDGAGYLAWRPHPNTGQDAPVGFALVDGLRSGRHSMVAFWTAPAARRGGVGRRLALEVLGRHTGSWSIAFQHDNLPAAGFWRAVADTAFGPGRWSESRRAVPDRPHLPADHVIDHPPGVHT